MEIIITAVFGGIATIIGIVGTHYATYKKVKSEEAINQETITAYSLYKQINLTLQEDVARYKKDCDELEEAYLNCREANAEIRTENKYLKAENEFLRKKTT